MQLLGQNLLYYSKQCQSTDYKFISRIAIDGLKILQKLHRSHFIHNDIKPHQFLFFEKTSKLFLVDFGLSEKFKINNKHRPMEEKQAIVGSCLFSSINCHNRVTLSRRDDIISFFYMLIYLIKGSLP